MTEDRDEILDELRALMAVEPTPGFEGRVWREVAERVVRPAKLLWAGAAAMCAVVVAVVAMRTQPPPEPEPRAVNTAAIPSPSMPAPAASRPAAVAHVLVRTARVAKVTTLGPVEPEVLVPPDQAIVLARLLAGIREGRVMIGQTMAMAEDVTVVPLSEPEPVTVTEIRIDSLPLPGGAS